MNSEERKGLAQQLDANPLFNELMDEMNKDAMEALVYAPTEQDRVEAQWRVRSVRDLTRDVQRIISDPQKRKGKVA